MKKIITLQLFILISLFLAAQNYEITNQQHPMAFGEVVAPIGNGEVLVGTISGQFFGWGSFLPECHKLDESGNIIWTTDLNIGNVFGDMKMVTDLKVLNESTYYAVVSYNGCDYIGYNVLIRFNGDGTPQWVVPQLGNSFISSKITLVGEDKILVSSSQQVFLINDSGSILWEQSTPIYYALDVFSYSDTSVLVVGEAGYFLLNHSVNPPTTEFTSSIHNYKIGTRLNSGEVVLLSEVGLHKLDNNLEPVDSFLFDFEHQFSSMDSDGENIFLFGKNQNDSTILQTLNSNFDFLTSEIIGGENLIPRDIKVDNDNLVLTAYHLDGFKNETNTDYFYSSTGPFGFRNSSLWVRSLPKDNFASLPKPDIGVSNVSIGAFEIMDSTYCFLPYSQANFIFEDVRVTIKNYGETTVNQFNLNGLFTLCPFICPSWISEFKNYSNVNLQPGEEFEIDLGDLEYFGLRYESGVDFEICYWTSNPDGKSDQVFSNNQFCQPIGFITDIDEFIFSEGINIFPNPANELLSIELPDELIGEEMIINILDSQGKSLKQYFSENKKTEQFNVQDLAEGIYFLQIRCESGKIFSKKFIKAK